MRLGRYDIEYLLEAVTCDIMQLETSLAEEQENMNMSEEYKKAMKSEYKEKLSKLNQAKKVQSKLEKRLEEINA